MTSQPVSEQNLFQAKEHKTRQWHCGWAIFRSEITEEKSKNEKNVSWIDHEKYTCLQCESWDRKAQSFYFAWPGLRGTHCVTGGFLSLMQHWLGNKHAYTHAHVLFDSAEKAYCPCLLQMSEGLHPKFCVEARSWSRWPLQVWEWLPGWGKERPWDAGCLET